MSTAASLAAVMNCLLDCKSLVHYKATIRLNNHSHKELGMDSYKHQVTETVKYLSTRIGTKPGIGLLTGTGLGEIVKSIEITDSFAYQDLPNFPVSTVQSHTGRLLFGRLKKRPVMVMQGRIHLYEGYSPREVTFPIRVMQELGVKTLILTNAAGGLNLTLAAGDIMIIRDHINLTGANPLVGPNEVTWGIRFPDMTRAYDSTLAALAENAGRENHISLKTGVYVGLKGPSLETPAEVRFLKTIGADAVGLSTVQEVIAAVHAGMKVLGLSTITNINDPDRPSPATVEEIIAVAEEAAPKLDSVICNVVEHIDDEQLS
jgi:purine-nucleoside phosphorylase